MANADTPSIAVELEGRRYGGAQSAEESFAQQIPSVFQEIAVDLRERSALIALEADPTLPDPKKPIFEAYAKDLALLKGRLTDFERWTKKAVYCSLVGPRREDSWDDRSKAEKRTEVLWLEFQQEIPLLGETALIALPHTRAAKEPVTLLAELKAEFRLGVDRCVRRMALWWQALVEREFLGLVEWSGLDTGCYHYFRHDQRQEVLGEHKRTEHAEDPSKPPGQRNEDRVLLDRTIRTQRLLERHVHHIVGAKLYRAEEYPRKVPRRVAEFLNEAPEWFRPFIHIVEGQITMEEIHRRVVSDVTRTETMVLSVNKYSPAVAVGTIALTGWSSDDLAREETSFYRRQDAAVTARLKKIKKTLWSGALIGSALAAVALLGIWGVQGYRASEARVYAAYVAGESSERQVYEVKKGALLVLDGEGAEVRYGGIPKGGYPVDSITLGQAKKVLGPDGREREAWNPRHFILVRGPDRVLYGIADLAPEMAVFVRIHVLAATEEGISYTVSKYEK